MEKVVFLDRDGTISKDSVNHIKSWEEFHFLPNAKQGLKQLHQHGYNVIIITNQSVIARKMVTLAELDFIHRKMIQEIEAAGGKIKTIYFCPHHPDDGCSCRKPNPGLLLRAIQEHAINPKQSYMVGDRIMDVEVGKVVECKTILIENEQGLSELQHSRMKPDYIAHDLVDVAQWIIQDYKTRKK